ncbi:MAG TPA: hypothetical protein VHB98_10995 [Chloroflexota bacterium]|jgi:hypothetical protein|nr:hypothetical protein [Chloroflexota bacterium]
MTFGILAAASTSGGWGSIATVVQSVADGMKTIMLPLCIVGLLIGIGLTMMQYRHGPEVAKTALIAGAVAAIAPSLASALVGTAGGSGSGQ